MREKGSRTEAEKGRGTYGKSQEEETMREVGVLRGLVLGVCPDGLEGHGMSVWVPSVWNQS